MNAQLKSVAATVVVAVMGLALAACENKAQTGALVGSGAGAGLGAIIGHQSGNTATGALIGAGAGAVGGYIVGNEMDKSDAKKREESRDNTRATRERSYDQPASNRLSTNDVIKWTDQGVKDAVIVDRIDRSGTVFNLSPQEENRLRDAQVSEEVIRAMKNTARR